MRAVIKLQATVIPVRNVDGVPGRDGEEDELVSYNA